MQGIALGTTRVFWASTIAFSLLGALGCGSDSGGKGQGGAANSGAGGAAPKGSGGAGGISNPGSTGGVMNGSTGGVGGSTPIPNVSCTKPQDCGDVNAAICNPADGKCSAFQCSRSSPCPNGQICLPQVDAATGGACYPACVPFKAGCPADFDCVSLAHDNSEGFCLKRGTSSTTCDATDRLSTGCVTGKLCAEGSCIATCDFFSEDPGCPANMRCGLNGECIEITGDTGASGEPCSASATPGTACGNDGKAWRGVCLNDGTTTDCYDFCRVADDGCPMDSSCVSVNDQLIGVGACVPTGPCGDGGAEHATCDACVTAERAGCCETQAEACVAGSACDTVGQCVSACDLSDDACIDACIDATPAGLDPLVDLLVCLYGDADEGLLGACGSLCQ